MDNGYEDILIKFLEKHSIEELLNCVFRIIYEGEN
jgi:hypothetical protein